jgi:hypothetical protein
VDWIDLAQDKGRVAGCCEHDKELSVSIKCVKFLDQLKNDKLLK